MCFVTAGFTRYYLRVPRYLTEYEGTYPSMRVPGYLPEYEGIRRVSTRVSGYLGPYPSKTKNNRRFGSRESQEFMPYY